MRTRTTTREGTANKAANYPLKMFLHQKGWHELYKKLEKMQCIKVVTDPLELTDDPAMAEIISEYIKNGRDRDLRE